MDLVVLGRNFDRFGMALGARSGGCTPRVAMWLKNAESPLNPPPEINVEGFNIFFFVFQHVPATPISAGSYGRLFLPPLIFVKKDAYSQEVLFFIHSKKRQNRAFLRTALLLVVNKVAIKRCFHAIRERPGGLQVVYLPPSPQNQC